MSFAGRTLMSCWLLGLALISVSWASQAHDSPDWFYPAWASQAEYAGPIQVRDTESALGRYASRAKEISLKDLARMHGHFCDGLVSAFVQLKAALRVLFKDGIVDRTDIYAVSKNGPCWVDAAAMVTGARINFMTLRIDNSVGDGFIIGRFSSGVAVEVHLKPGVFPEELAELEKEIRLRHRAGSPVSGRMIDRYQRLADELSRKLLNTKPDAIVDVAAKPGYKFRFTDLYAPRGDVILKALPRK